MNSFVQPDRSGWNNLWNHWFNEAWRNHQDPVAAADYANVMMTTMMVFIMVFLASIFFLLSDLVIRQIVDLVLGIGG